MAAAFARGFPSSGHSSACVGSDCRDQESPTERIGTPHAFSAWLLAAGLVAAPVTASTTQLRRGSALREATARTVRALVAGREPAEFGVEEDMRLRPDRLKTLSAGSIARAVELTNGIAVSDDEIFPHDAAI
jgi:hypothetical protein